MNCAQIQEKLTDYFFNELPLEEMAGIRSHVESCQVCRAELAKLEAVTGEIGRGMDVPAFSEEEVQETVRKAGTLSPAKPRFGLWVWAPAAAVLVVGFLVMTVMRYSSHQRDTFMAARGPLEETAKRDNRRIVTSPSAGKVENQQGLQASDRPLSKTIQDDKSALGNKKEVRGGSYEAKAPVPAQDQLAKDQRQLRNDEGRSSEVKGLAMGDYSSASVQKQQGIPMAPPPVAAASKPGASGTLAADSAGRASSKGRAANETQFQEKIIVTGQAPVVDSTQTTSGYTYDQANIQKPAAGFVRDYQSQAAAVGGGKGNVPGGAPAPAQRDEASVQRRAGTGQGEVVRKKAGNLPAPAQAPAGPTNVGGSVPPNGQPFPSMFFEHAGVNPFITTEEDPLSTFAVDVDTASYTVARNYLMRGQMPPKEAVRVEEFVNAFDQGYPKEYRRDFAIHADGMPSPFGKGYQLLRIGLVTRSVSEHERRPMVLTFVIDVSGSMHLENRLELVKRSLRLLVDRLDERDSIGIAVFGTNGRELLPPTSVADKRRILDAVMTLHPEGSTNAQEGISIGYRMASQAFNPRAVNRVILCTDGVANEGVTGAEAILSGIKPFVDRGIFLTALGFGMGNYNDVLLEKLADKGNGVYAYIDDDREAEKFFLQDLAGLLETVAKDVKIQVEFNPKTVARYRLLGFENRDLRDQDFRNDKVDAGEINSGHTVTALYEIKWTEKRGELGTVRVRYKSPLGEKAREIAMDIPRDSLASSFERADGHLQTDSLVAEFAEYMRGSYWAKDGSFEAILGQSRMLKSDQRSLPQVSEFLRLVEEAARLHPPPAAVPAMDEGHEGYAPEPGR